MLELSGDRDGGDVGKRRRMPGMKGMEDGRRETRDGRREMMADERRETSEPLATMGRQLERYCLILITT